MNSKVNNEVLIYVVGNDIPINKNEINFVYVNSIEELALETPAICILSLSPKDQNNALLYLHAHLPIWNGLLYVLQESLLSPYLSDGIWNPFNYQDRWVLHQEKLALIQKEPADKLLAWLWLAPHRRLSPICQSDQQAIYNYPLFNCYSKVEDSPYHYFQLAEKMGYVEKGKTLDKIRLCPSCNSGHLNYIETCPACKSTNIDEIISLHCFTCGHIDKEESFTKKEKLECSNCFTKLRHIGVDYDRPLERYHCGDCHLSFSESVVRVRCLSCFVVNEVNDLVVRPIHEFKIGEQVGNLMMYGRRAVEQELTLNGLIDKTSFHNLLVWINKLALRHEQSHVLLGVKVSGIENYTHQFGEIKRLQLIDTISNNFNGILRDTDICCQYDNEILLLLMPMTPTDSSPIIEHKIKGIADSIESELIDLNVYIWSLPDKQLHNNASGWLATHFEAIAHG